MTASEIFDAIAPHLASDSRKETFVTLAASRMSSSARWGAAYAEAQAQLAAHMLTLSASDGSTAHVVGAIVSRSAGALSETRAAPSARLSRADSELARTSFGLAFMALRDTRVDGRMGLVVG